MAPSDASSFVIRQLGSPPGELPRVMVLTGRGLPYRPFTLRGTMRKETFWAPGNPIGSMQVLGGQLEQTTIKGAWKEKYLGDPEARPVTINGFPMTSVPFALQELDAIRAEGQLVQVTWDEVTRVGLLSSLTQEWDRRQDCSWEMVFDWISDGAAEVPAVLPNQGAVSASLAASWQQLNAAALAVAQVPPPNPNPDVLQQVNEALEGWGTLSSQISDGVATVADQVLGPVAAARMLAGVLAQASSVGDAVLAVLGARVDRAVLQGDHLANDVGACLRAAAWTRDLLRQARQLKRQGAVDAAGLSVEGNLLGVWLAREGESLRDVALRYYGVADQWQTIATANRLEGVALTAGQVVLVPQLDRGT